MKLAISVILLCLAFPAAVPLARAQGNYEVQVYGSETVARGSTMLELHSNYTAAGERRSIDGTEPTNHAVHETIEITQGLNDWSEVGFYIFTSAHSGQGIQWVGDHIRPRVRVPNSWHWPVGASLSMEIGYQRAVFSTDTWTWEIRPIIDKQAGHFYWAINPAFERTWHGPGIVDGVDFAPNVKVSYDFSRQIAGGIEYYADYGDIRHTASLHNQQQMFFPAVDLNVSPQWELNFGVGVGATAGSDHWLVKGIVGRRFDWGRKR